MRHIVHGGHNCNCGQNDGNGGYCMHFVHDDKDSRQKKAWSTTQLKRCYLSHVPNFASLFSPQFCPIFLSDSAHHNQNQFSRSFLFLPASLTGFPCLGSNCPGLETFCLLLLLKLQKCHPFNQVVQIFILFSDVESSMCLVWPILAAWRHMLSKYENETDEQQN